MNLISGIATPKRHKCMKEGHVNTSPVVLPNGPDYSRETKASTQLSMTEVIIVPHLPKTN
jgi:hypothetical protein